MLTRKVQHEAAQAAFQELFGREYIASNPSSLAHIEKSVARFPSGVTHDGRYAEPFGPTIVRAAGAYKWDADGHRYIDFVTGHGALILGHNHPTVIEAVSNQLQNGTHLGGNHRLELEWAERICEIVPGAESVRFTSSGTEATMLAIRMARNFTGRTTLVQFQGHFHGWSDTTFGGAGGPGLPAALQSLAQVLPCGDLQAVEQALAEETVAAVIIETSHPSFFGLPDPGAFLAGLRRATEKTGSLLICDEVVSGFRWAPGGVQEYYGSTADLTTLAKILAGGLPGGAIAGRSDIVNTLSFDPTARGGRAKIAHPGTYNGNPLSAAAGSACLSIVRDPEIQQQATGTATAIRTGMNAVLREVQVPGCVYGDASMGRIALGGEDLPPEADLRAAIPGAPGDREGTTGPVAQALFVGMLLKGVYLFNSRFIASIAHSEADIDLTVNAFGETLEQMKTGGLLA
jgi:glutamate-1-semialdehyde 2,1-aminomutase